LALFFRTDDGCGIGGSSCRRGYFSGLRSSLAHPRFFGAMTDTDIAFSVMLFLAAFGAGWSLAGGK
jgi:hypothetical protein